MSGSRLSAGTSGKGTSESFYPPRAGFWAPARLAWWRLVRSCRLPALQAVIIPSGLSLREVVLSILLPGYGFRAVGSRVMGNVMVGISLLCAILYGVAFGSFFAWWAGVTLLTLHTIGLGLLVGKILPAMHFFVMPISCAMLCLLIYIPAQKAISCFFLPLRTANGVVIIHRRVPGNLGTGNWVAYQFPAHYRDGVRVRGGLGLGKILAQPGDEITFSQTSFAVNGLAHPRLDNMPGKGNLVLASEEWFIWPEFSRSVPAAHQERLSVTYLEYSVVPRGRVLGIPLKRWLWRNTPLP